MTISESARLQERYAGWSNEELISVLHPAEGYLPTAAEIAQRILSERGVDLTQPASQAVMDELDRKHAELEERSEAPLSPWLRALCAILPGLPAWIVIGISILRRRRRSEEQAITWMLVGFAARFGIGLGRIFL